MSSNTVYIIGDKRTGKMFDAKNKIFTIGVDFSCFFPTYEVAEEVKTETIYEGEDGDYEVVEVEVVRFLNGELVVTHKPFSDKDLEKFF